MKDANNKDNENKTNITTEIKNLFENGLNTEQIKTELSKKGINKDNHYIRNITYRLRVREGLIKPQQEQTTTDATQEKSISLSVYENEEHNLILFIKTCIEFENYLKANKELKQTSNLWGNNDSGEYYHLRLDNDSNLDDINQSIFRGYRQIALNRAILRIKGISEGLNFNLGDCGLISENALKIVLKSFVKVYQDFYKKNILNQKLNIKIEGIIENDN